MATELRKTGISVVGDLPWGAHFCYFYETKQDLLDVLIPYFKTGLENKEFCLWVISNSELLTVQEATSALRDALPDLDRYVAERSIEVVGHEDWFLSGSTFDRNKVANRFRMRLNEALARGYAGMRVNGSPAWLSDAGPKELRKFEAELDKLFPNERTIASCTYPLASIGGEQIFDVVRTHQFAIARRQGEWEVIETPEPIQAKAEIERLNKELQRVRDRTPESPAILKYGVAVLSVIASLIIAQWMDVHLVSAPASLFLCAIMFSAWYGRVKPGLLAMVLSLLAFKYYSLTPIHSLALDVNQIPRLVIFVIAALLVGSVSAAQGKVAESLRRARDVLDGTVQQLKRKNEALRREITERKRAEEEVRKSEDHLRLVTETIPALIWCAQPDGSVDFINQRHWEFTGLSLDDVGGWRWTDVIHPEDRARVVDEWRAALATGEALKTEARLRRAFGDYRWLLIRSVPLRNESGKIVKWYGTKTDITERKQAEDALRTSEDRNRLIIDTIPTMAWSLRPDGTVDFVNQRWLDYTGLTWEQYVRDPTGLIHPEDKTRVVEEWLADMAAGEPYEAEMRLRQADGKYRWFLVRTAPVRDEQGALVKWYGVSIDIEDRVQAEEKIKQRESQLAEAQRLAHVGSWDYDLRTNSVTWSDELYRIFGIPPGKIKAAGDAVPFIHPGDRDLVFRTVKSSIESQEPYSFHYRILRSDGDERIVHSRGFIVTDTNGNPIRVVGATQDVTELKRAEEKLKATSEQLRALSASLQAAKEEEATRIAREIHDELGASLSSLRWDLEDIDEGLSGSGEQAQVEELRQKIAAMMRLSDITVNTVRRIASELRPIALDTLGLGEAIEWQARQFQERTGVVVQCDCDPESVDVSEEQSTAAFRIFQEALTNILRHAQATTVHIQMKEKDGEFILAISENGRGITDDEKSGQNTLGLLGMRERAHLLGGKIDITGSSGKGTVIIVHIPISAANLGRQSRPIVTEASP